MGTLQTLLLIVFFPVLIMAQWEWQNGMPPKQNILKIISIEPDIFFAAGESGLIIKSTDNGLHWVPQTTNSTLTINDLEFIDGNSGFAVGDNGLFLKTSNGGNNWSKVEMTTTNNLISISYFGPDNIWIGGEAGLIIHSSDNGISWVTQNSQKTSIISDIHFSNLSEGCAFTYDGFNLYTSDGGDNWESFDISSKLYRMAFSDENTGYGLGSFPPPYYPPTFYGNILKTTDKGRTWNLVKSVWDTGFRDIYVKNNIVYAAGYESFAGIDFCVIYQGTGNYFYKVLSGPHAERLNSIAINNTTGISISSEGNMFNTSIPGENWNFMFEDKSYDNFINGDFIESTGWALGDTVLLKTSNGGVEWQKVLGYNGTDFNKVLFNNLSQGWLGGTKLYKTNTGGLIWTEFDLDSSGTIYDIFFIDENIGWITQGKNLIKTTDGGQSWSYIYLFDSYSGNIFFIDEDYGWIASANQILRTTNGGNNWLLNDSLNGQIIRDIFFINRTTGWAVEGANIWYTIDGGLNWDFKQITGTEYFNSIYFVSPLKGFICGRSGLLLKTIDGGINWEKIIINTPIDLRFIKFIDDETGWVLGSVGIILKTTNGGTTFVSPNNEINFKSLSQNYPNPFNPATIIQYTLTGSQFVSLKIFDILGREIRTLVYEEKHAGEYSVEFNGYGLPSGVYFYRLQLSPYENQGRNFVETKKMILIK